MLTTWWRQPIQRRNSIHTVVSSFNSPEKSLSRKQSFISGVSNVNNYHRKLDQMSDDATVARRSSCYEIRLQNAPDPSCQLSKSVKKINPLVMMPSRSPLSLDNSYQRIDMKPAHTGSNDSITLSYKQNKYSNQSTCSSSSQLMSMNSKSAAAADLLARRRLTNIVVPQTSRVTAQYPDVKKSTILPKQENLRRLTTVSAVPQSRRRLSIKSLNSPSNESQVDKNGQVTLDLNRGSIYKRNTLSPHSASTFSNFYVTQLNPILKNRRISVSGALTNARLGNFENKLQRVTNSSADRLPHALRDLGIGFMCKKGLKPESYHQDDFFIARFTDWGLYGVFDGHGAHGHHVANYIQKEFLSFICNEFHSNSDYEDLLRRSFSHAEESLERHAAQFKAFDCALSGTTATVVLHLIGANKLYIAWVGDSRCVLGRFEHDQDKRKFEAVPLTEDHKPNNPEEHQRIVAAGGHVCRLEGDIPYRVFMKHHLYPGLAMSRALGDTIGQKIGVSCEPQIIQHDIDQARDFCLCLSSDGVWEFMSPQEVIQIIVQHGPSKVQVAADSIGRESWKRWIKNEGNVVDDITTEIIFFNQKLSSIC